MAATSSAFLPADLEMGPVRVSVADLDRTVSYYERSIGLVIKQRGDGTAVVGTPQRSLLVFDEVPGAQSSFGYCGLYHVALLVPTRRDLANWLRHAMDTEVRLVGMSDHFVSEAIYLSDPDGHGIEIYADRPRHLWEGRADRMTIERLDARSLLDEADGNEFKGLAEGTVMGHVHLKVADVPETIAFYTKVVGFDLTAAFGVQAAFFSAGGYHHHVGANIWGSHGAPPAPEGSARLEEATVLLPDETALAALGARLQDTGRPFEAATGGLRTADPAGNKLFFTVRA